MSTVGRWLLWVLALVVVILVLVQGWYAMHILWWRDHAPSETAFMAMRDAELHGKGKTSRRAYQWIPYERISPALKRAMIAAEDARFVEHEGFDWEGIQQAMDKNYRKGRVVAGGSTITQQLAKNLFLSSQRSYWRKAEEAVITLMLEALLDKRRIFELYLNVIELGDGVFGAGPLRDTTSESARPTLTRPRPRGWLRWRRTRAITNDIRTHAASPARFRSSWRGCPPPSCRSPDCRAR